MGESGITALPWDHLECHSDHEGSPLDALSCDSCFRATIQFLKPHLVCFGFSAVKVMALMTTQSKEFDRDKRLDIVKKDTTEGRESSAALLIDYLLPSSRLLTNIFMRSLRRWPPVDVHDTVIITCMCLSAHRNLILHIVSLLATGQLQFIPDILSSAQPSSADGSPADIAGTGSSSRQAVLVSSENETVQGQSNSYFGGFIGNLPVRDMVDTCERRSGQYEPTGGAVPTNQGRSSDPIGRAIDLFASLYFRLAKVVRESLEESRDTSVCMAWWDAVATTLNKLPDARYHMPSSEKTARLLKKARDILQQDPYMEVMDNGQAGCKSRSEVANNNTKDLFDIGTRPCGSSITVIVDHLNNRRMVLPKAGPISVGTDVSQTNTETRDDRLNDEGEPFPSNISMVSSSTDEWNNLARYSLPLHGMPPHDIADLRQLSEGPIALRPYQEELLESARKGRNVLIWLDTGAGKTYIVLKYAEEHLKEDKKRRMVFVVPKVRLAQQQFARFVHYLPDCNPHLRCGPVNSGTRSSFSHLIQTCRIFVVTAQCLVEAVERKEVTLSQFSLMVLDECHHTRGGHPFKQLMNQYMEIKFGSPAGSSTLPQIIGLTASPGIGRLRGGKPEQAVQHLYLLTASLDIEEICSVRRNVRDLEEHVARPKHDIRTYQKSTKDTFKDQIHIIMQEIIRNMHHHRVVAEFYQSLQVLNRSKAEKFKKSLIPPSLETKENYAEWLNSRDKQFLNVNPSVRYTILACVDALKIYLKALTLHEDCQATDALSFLKEEVDRIRSSNAQRANVDLELIALFDAYLPILETKAEEIENPKLKVLEELILSGIKQTSQDTEWERQELSSLISSSPNSQQLEMHHIGELVMGFPELNNLSSTRTVSENIEKMSDMDDDSDAMSVRTTTADEDQVHLVMQTLDAIRDDDDDDDDDDAITCVSSLDGLESASVLAVEDVASSWQPENYLPSSECDKEVRGMIFVRTLELTRLIPRWINRHPELSWLNPGRITGATACASQGGMTKREVAEVMEDFNRGIHKILVCTSAAEEGLDFRACNLVIRYDYESSLVSMIQTRGRARQKNALYGVLVNPLKDSIGKEQQNINSEVLMREAVATFQDRVAWDREGHKAFMARTQLQNYKKRWRKDVSQIRKLQEKLPEASYQLLCRKCSSFACHSSDVKRLKSTNHVVIGANFCEKYSRLSPNVDQNRQYDKDLPKTGNLACKSCDQHWGIIVKYVSENLEFPVIKIGSFYLQNEKKERFLVEKWSKAFPVPELRDEDREKHKMSLTSEAGLASEVSPHDVKEDNVLNGNLNTDSSAAIEFARDKMDFPRERRESTYFREMDDDLEDNFNHFDRSDSRDELNDLYTIYEEEEEY